MSLGPGKYDEECGEVQRATGAEGVLLIVLGGNRGTGFSVHASLLVLDQLPAILRSAADQIETDDQAFR